jgi:hypothetical protein
MATESNVQSITLPAAADYSSASQFRFVNVNSSGQAVRVSSAGGDAIGVLQNKPDAAGKAATVATSGIVKVVAGGTIAAGAKVQSDASGDALTAASGDAVLGVALASAVDGDVFPVLLVSKHILA